MANGLQLLAHLVQLLRWKHAGSDPGRVGFDHGDDLFDGTPSNREARENPPKSAVGGGAEGICAVVQVQQDSVGTFDEDCGIGGFRGPEERDLINNEWLQFVSIYL